MYAIMVFCDTLGRVLGMVLGAKFMKFGRRKMCLIGLAINFFGGFGLQVMIWPVFLIGTIVGKIGGGII